MKKLLWAAALLCAATMAHASDTSVLATVTDTDGQAWLNGTWSAVLSLPSGPFGNQTPTIGGMSVPTKKRGIINASGQIVTILTDTSSLDQPGGQWVIQACPNASTSENADTGCVKVKSAIAGASVDLSSRFSGVIAPRFPAGPNAYGYSDHEVLPAAIPGVQYYNTGNDLQKAGLRVWDGKIWQGVGGGGGGGRAIPAGATNEFNAKLDTSTFQGSGLFTNNAHTFINIPAAQWAQAQVNMPPNSLCGGRGCGQITNYGQNIPNNDGNGNLTGFAQAYFNYRNALYTGQGLFNGFIGSPNEASGGAVTKLQNDNIVFQSPGITQSNSSMTFCSKPYDCSAFYPYIFDHGGLRTGGDEGVTGIRVGGGNAFQRLGQGTITGSPAPGATTVTLTSLTNASDFFVGGFLINQTGGPVTTGNITAYDQPGNLLTVTPGSVTQAAANGTTTQAIQITGIPTVNGQVKSITTHFDNGTDTQFRDGLIVFGCSTPDLEFVNATVTAPDGSGNQVITGTFYHGHPTGCKVAQGGTQGVLDLVADRQVGSVTWRTSYFVFAAPDNSHIYLRSYLLGGLGPIEKWKHNFGYQTTNPIISRTANVATVCNLNNLPYMFAGQYIRVSGATPSDFNGNYTASILNANRCLTYPNPGVDVAPGGVTGATVATGGDVNSPDGTTLGTGGFAIWKTAVLRQIGTTSTTSSGITTQAYNNQLILYPNDLSFANGNTLLMLDDMQNKTEPLSAFGSYDTAPSTSTNKWMNSRFVGSGVAGDNFRGLNVQNDNLFTLYKGGGAAGLLDGAIGLNIEGPYQWGIRMTAPLPSGRGIEILQNPMITANSGNNSFYVLDAVGVSGNPGFAIDYNPNLGITHVQSGKADGIASVITINPTTMQFDASSSITLVAPTVTIPSLQSAGTRCVQAGPTGTITATSSPCATVSSIGIAPPAWASVTGSPVTTSGNITLNLPAFNGSGTNHAPGIVPDPGGTVGTTRFLREDGTWSTPTGLSGKCSAGQTPNFVNGLAVTCS